MLLHSTKILTPGNGKEIEAVNKNVYVLGIGGRYRVRRNHVKLENMYLFDIEFNNRFNVISTAKQEYRHTNGDVVKAEHLEVNDAVEGLDKTFFVSKKSVFTYKNKRAFYSLSLYNTNNWLYVEEGVLTREMRFKYM